MELTIQASNSRAILIGTSSFGTISSQIPQISRNVENIFSLLSNEKVLGIPHDNIVTLSDIDRASILKELINIGKIKLDTLIVYYTGHGIRTGVKKLLLTARDTEKEYEEVTGIPFSTLRDIIERSKASKKILILDCCYSGIAALDIDNASPLTQQEIIKGTYIITSSPFNEKAYFDTDEELTYFTGELVKILKLGIENDNPFISLNDLYDKLKDNLIHNNHAEPQRLDNLNISKCYVFKNTKFNAVEIGDTIRKKETVKLFAQALTCKANKNFNEAISILNKILILSPDDPNAHRIRGDVFSDMRNYDQASIDYEKVIDLGIRNSAILNGLGNAKMNMGKYDDAIAAYDSAIEIEPFTLNPYLGRASVMFRLRHYDNALADYDEAIRMFPDYIDGRSARGFAKEILHDIEGAREDFNYIVEKFPFAPNVYLLRAQHFHRLKKYFEAIKDYDKAVELNPKYFDAIAQRARCKNDMGNWFDATKDYDQLIEVFPNWENLFIDRGNSKVNQGNYDGALEDYLKAVELNPYNHISVGALGYIYNMMNLWNEAIFHFTNAIKMNSKYEWAYTNRGLAYENLGEYELALKDYRKSSIMNEKNGEAFFRMGNILFKQGKLKEACANWKTASDLKHEGAQINIRSVCKEND